MARDVPPNDGKVQGGKTPQRWPLDRDQSSGTPSQSSQAVRASDRTQPCAPFACDAPDKKRPDTKTSQGETSRGETTKSETRQDCTSSEGDASASAVNDTPRPDLSPIDYLTSVYRDESVPRERRMDAAKAVVAYVHPRMTPAKASGSKKPPRRIVVVWGPPD